MSAAALIPIVYANPRRGKRRTPPRGKGGKFVKRGAPSKRRAPAKRRRRARRATTTALVPVRRRNPSPARGRRRHRTHAVAHHAPHRGRRLRRRVHRNPIRLGAWGPMIRTAIGGFAGILVAKISGNLYRDYISGFVRGGATDGWRAWVDDLLRIVVMEASVYGAHKLAQRIKVIDASALFAGGTAETFRQALGAVVRNVSPGFNRSTVGLDGNPAEPDAQTVTMDDGRVWVLDGAGRYELAGALGDDGEFYALDEIPELAVNE